MKNFKQEVEKELTGRDIVSSVDQNSPASGLQYFTTTAKIRIGRDLYLEKLHLETVSSYGRIFLPNMATHDAAVEYLKTTRIGEKGQLTVPKQFRCRRSGWELARPLPFCVLAMVSSSCRSNSALSICAKK